ncbi:hypothetical protein EV191_110210 [Tamaricihabitans halophyticus]|uniref:Uncharacterized protein n=1 Tax=Tamaricihabitans halophyticus TaxID=1262583 RepID=A0A4R2QIP5_9PSEU|nr:hypothetical protein EV191_110210 [Tamaricihabitans halophyticus]
MRRKRAKAAEPSALSEQMPEPSRYASAPLPRPAGPPASSTPLRDYLSVTTIGVSDGYAVLPRSLVESMPLPWQQQMAHLLAQFHQTHQHLSWPTYRVVPSRYERLVDLDEDQLAEVGCMVEIDTDGELVYRERGGRRIDEPENTMVLVSCLDPIPSEHANATDRTPPSGIPQPQQAPGMPGGQAPGVGR